MYRFSGKGSSLPWHNLRIEVQLRTKLQHSWATCVETVDAFSGEDLKFGKGASDWRRFFQLIGTVHARIEKTMDVANTPKSQDRLLSEVKGLESKLQVIHTLRSYAQITQHIMRKPDNERRDWFLIQMRPDEKQVLVQGYPITLLAKAKQHLAEFEEMFQGTKNQAALVATSSLAELKKAYPNYFADTTHFIATLERFLN